MKGILAAAIAVFGFLAGTATVRADDPDLIFRKTTVWKFLSPDHKLGTYAIDDPEVEGVACYFTVPEKGGWIGWLGLAEELVRRLNIEMADELREHVIRLGMGRQADAEFRELQQIAHHAFLERALVGDPVGRARARGEQVLRAQHGRMNEPARRLVHGQGAQAMAEERERPVQQLSHLGHEPIDELVHVGDRRFGDAAEAAGRLDGDHLDRGVDELRPASIDRRASTGERKAEQPKARRRAALRYFYIQAFVVRAFAARGERPNHEHKRKYRRGQALVQ